MVGFADLLVEVDESKFIVKKLGKGEKRWSPMSTLVFHGRYITTVMPTNRITEVSKSAYYRFEM